MGVLESKHAFKILPKKKKNEEGEEEEEEEIKNKPKETAWSQIQTWTNYKTSVL